MDESIGNMDTNSFHQTENQIENQIENQTKIQNQTKNQENAMQWIESMKRKQTEKNNEQKTIIKEKKEYGAVNLVGLKVLHDATELNPGMEVILTLKDEKILVGGIENEAMDALENVDLIDLEKAQRNRELKLKIKSKRTYDDLFNNTGQSNGVSNDPDHPEMKPVMILNEDGQVTEQEIKQAKLKQRLAAYEAANFDLTGRVEYSLNPTDDTRAPSNLVLQSEYESVIFKKKPGKAKNSTVSVDKSKIRKAIADDSEETDGFRIPEPLLQSQSNQNHGSRNASRKVVKDQEDEERTWLEKNRKFALAKSKANEQAQNLSVEIRDESVTQEMNLIKSTLPYFRKNEIPDDFDYQEALSLKEKLAKRNTVLIKNENEETVDKGGIFVKDEDDPAVQATIAKLERFKNRDLKAVPLQFAPIDVKPRVGGNLFSGLVPSGLQQPAGFASVLPGKLDAGVAVFSKMQQYQAFKAEHPKSENITELPQNGITFTATQDFVANIQTTLERKSRLMEVDEPEESRSIVVGKPVIEKSNMRTLADDKPLETDSEAKGKAELSTSFLDDELDAGGGLTQALALARQRGLISENRHLLGRAKDKKEFQFESKLRKENKKTADYDFQVNLKYLNEEGEEMTQREAWRKLSHEVHGTFPGKNKQAAEFKRKQLERKQNKVVSTAAALATANKTAQALEESGSAFLELNAKGSLSSLKRKSSKKVEELPTKKIKKN